MVENLENAASSSSLETADANGRAAVDRDDLGAAVRWFQEALRLARVSGDDPATVYGLFHVAWVLRYGFRRVGEAGLLLEEAGRIADSTGSERLIWSAIINLADAALDAADWRPAASLAAEALRPTWNLERPLGDMTFLVEIAAFAAAGWGADEEARCLYGSAREARRGQGWDPNTVRVIRERSERLMTPALIPYPDRGHPIADEEPPIPLDSAVALAIALPRVLLHVSRGPRP